MALLFSNGDSFATGAVSYDYRPATNVETTNRLTRFLEGFHPADSIINC